jgi:hypothetical protein
MTAPTPDSDDAPEADGPQPDNAGEESGRTDLLGAASLVLSAIGFLTLLRLADRTDRSPAHGVGLFLATTVESVGGTVLGLSAVGQSKDVGRPTRGVLLGAAGAVLGVVTTLLNLNWMRTQRRP